MSFNTPWGSSTRQDHPTFMNGAQPSNRSRDASKQQTNSTASGSAAISYAIGAATSPTRSPKKLTSTRLLPPPNPLSSSRGADSSFSVEIPFPSEEAAQRHLRLSQIHEARIQTIPEPKGTSFKDTSVNIASAFHQAATGMPPNGKPLSVSSSRNLNRGPSVDRLAAPKPPSSRGRPPTQPQANGDESGEGSSGRFKRAMSPLMETAGQLASAGFRAVSPGLVAAGSTLLSSASSMVRPQSVVLREPQYQSFSSVGQPTDEDSYDYAAEEALADTLGAASRASNGKKPHSKRKSLGKQLDPDNRAYKPPPEGYESESSDDDTRRPKKGIVVQRALLTGVPSNPTKKRPKRKSGSGQTAVSEDGSVQPRAGSLAESTAQGGPSRQGSQQPIQPPREEIDESREVEEEIAGPLDDSEIEEINRHEFEDDYDEGSSHIHHPSIGQRLGKIANVTLRMVLRLVGMVLLVIWNTLSAVYELVVTRPRTFLSGGWKEIKIASDIVNLKTIGAVVLIGGIAYSMYGSSTRASSNPATPRGSWFDSILGLRRRPVYTIPDIPAGSVDELVDRLRLLEGAFVNLEADHRQAVDEYRKGFHQVEADSRAKDTMSTRIMAMETKLEGETRRAMIAEENDRAAAKRTIGNLEDLISIIRGELASVHGTVAQQSNAVRPLDPRTDERIAVLEKELRNVSERLKTAVATDRKEHVKHVSADGKDLTQLVQNIISTGGVAMPDFALYYAGAVVEPRMTSKTLAIRRTWGRDNRGRPPVTALVPDITVGNCWPFSGSQGQLGIRLSRVIRLSHITIDHPPHDLLFDEKSAPRQFHVWIAVEGPEDLAKADAITSELDEMRSQGLAPELPTTPFGLWRLLYVGTFEYDVHGASNTQTFEIPRKYRDLQIDTGAIVVDFASNWGNADHTCVYRVRAHGSQVNSGTS